MLWLRFEQCLGPFTMLLFEEYSERGIFRHLSNHGFPNPIFRKYMSYEGRLFDGSLMSISKMAHKSWEKVFPFRDNCISIGSIKLSLLRREHLWLAVNVSKNVLRFCLLPRGTFSNLMSFKVINKYGKMCVIQISAVFDPIYHVDCRRVSWNATF